MTEKDVHSFENMLLHTGQVFDVGGTVIMAPPGHRVSHLGRRDDLFRRTHRGKRKVHGHRSRTSLLERRERDKSVRCAGR